MLSKNQSAHSHSLRMWVGLLTDIINNNLEKSNLIKEHELNRESVPLRPGYASVINTAKLEEEPREPVCVAV